MRPPLLYGEFELTIDDKNRLLVPAEIRRSIPPELGEALFVTKGTNGVLWMYPERYYEDLVMQVPVDMIPADDLVAYDQLYFGMAARLPWDKQGRILVPEKTLKRSALNREVTLIGARDHLELWNRAEWEARRDELDRRRPEVTQRARQARHQQQQLSVGLQ